MINKLVGMKLASAVELLNEKNILFDVAFYNDKKMNTSDETLVLRATKENGRILLVATNFLFSPESEK